MGAVLACADQCSTHRESQWAVACPGTENSALNSPPPLEGGSDNRGLTLHSSVIAGKQNASPSPDTGKDFQGNKLIFDGCRLPETLLVLIWD